MSQLRTVAPYIPAVAAFLFWLGLQMSGYTNQKLGAVLLVLSVVAWAIPIAVYQEIIFKWILEFRLTAVLLAAALGAILFGGIVFWLSQSPKREAPPAALDWKQAFDELDDREASATRVFS